MILQKIMLNNFGVFRGKHEFNLVPDLENGRPIILFGGLNGSGKTTLFEGIKLCLYGQTTFPELKTKKLYHSYISKKVKPLDNRKELRFQGFIEIQLEFNDFGVRDIYNVRRVWHIEKEKVSERFTVLKNNQGIGLIEKEYSQSFIANLIPLGVSNLFFFDGEKIQELAEDTIDNDFFKYALDSILGLDIIKKLEQDIKSYSRKENVDEDDIDLIAGIEKTISKIESNEQLLALNVQKKASIKTQLDKIDEIIQRKENELTLQGAGYAKRRIEFREKLTLAENNLDETRRLLKNIYGGLFPFTLVPRLCEQLQERIADENRRKNEKLTIHMINSKREAISNELINSNEFLESITNTKQQDIITSILQSITNVLQESTNGEYHFINDFSEKDLNQLLYWVDQTNSVIPQDIDVLSKRFKKNSEDRVYYENMLRMVPDNSILDPIIKEINAQHAVKGGLEIQLKHIEDEIAESKNNMSEDMRLLEIQEEKYELQNKFQRKMVLLRNIRRMLDEYKDAIRESKIDLMRDSFLDAISLIIRKHDFINDIKIDSNYNIQLQREDGNYIYKSMLSNGEKQIFAISMLLALARVSGRPLPFIIDTPLARLDSTHRDNIVENFFPNASHQVIIFSTDTEIDKLYFEKLTPYLTRVYHLEWSNTDASSNATEGYFWEGVEVTQN